MPSSPSVSVIIPAREAASSVAAAVESALRQDLVAEVVVAAGDPATRAAVERVADRRVSVVGNPEGTTPAALNRALRHSSGDIIVRCDAHSTLPPGYVARAVELLESTGAANVGGRQVPQGVEPFERAVAMAMVSPLGAGDARYRVGGRPGPTDTVYLGVFRRGELEAVGGFDETLERNQDYELNWRLRQKGGVVWFDPQLAVQYRPRSTARSLWRQYFDYGYWKRIVLRRHPDSLRWRQLAAPSLVVGLAASAVVALLDWKKGAALPAVYVATTAGAGVYDLVRRRDAAALLEPVALWVMHLAWGSGFIAGLLSGRR